MKTKDFRPISSIKDLTQAIEDNFARLTGDVYETSTPRLVDIAYASDNFGPSAVISVMRVSRATARRFGLAA